VLIDVMVRNRHDEKVATGKAMVEFPHRWICHWFQWDRGGDWPVRPEPAPPAGLFSKARVWIDIRAFDGLETASPG
jgi:hypothetical protein